MSAMWVMHRILIAAGICCLAGHPARCTPEYARLIYDATSLEADIKAAAQLLELDHPDSALHLYRKIYLGSKQYNYRPGIVKSLLESGKIYGNRSDFATAGKMFHEALGYCRFTDPTGWLLPELFFCTGSVYMAANDYAKTIMYYKAAMNLNGLYGFPVEPALLYHNAALMLRRIGSYDKSLDMVEKGLSSLDSQTHTEIYMDLLFSKSILLRWKGKEEESYAILEELWERAMERNSARHKFNVHTGRADLALLKSQPDEARAHMSQAAAIYGDHIPRAQKRQILYREGVIQYMKSDYANAITYFEDCLDLKETTTLFEIANIYKMLHQAYAALGIYDKAHTYQATYETLRDSLNKATRAELILKLDTRYQTQEKDKRLAANQFLLDRQQKSIGIRNAWLGAGISCAIVLITLLILAGKNYAHRKRLKEETRQHLIRNRALNEIKAAINGEEKEKARIARELHDGIMVGLSATRMMIDNVAEENEMVTRTQLIDISGALSQVTHDLRQTAYNLVPDMLLHEGLKNALHFFCSQVQRSASFSLSLSVPDDLPRFDSGFELTVYRIVQEVLQNVIKHAQATVVKASVVYNADNLSIAIEDNGVGMKDPGKVQQEGMGLKSIHARMTSVNGSFNVQSIPGEGTGIYLDFVTPPVCG